MGCIQEWRGLQEIVETGKLPPDILTRLLARTHTDPSVIIGPAYGEDAAAVRFGGKVLVAAADPITFATDHIGRYAVDVNANDIAVLGAVPRYFLATILLPEGSSETDAESVFNEIEAACRAIDVTLIGGHTEITPTVSRTVVSGCMLGEARKDSLIRTGGARVGDAVILAGGVAIEGTAILARENAPGVDQAVIDRALRFLDDPGISILRYARIAMEIGGVTAMHDPTEGGLSTALRELALASGKGVRIDRDAIPILPECRAICDALAIDPLGLIASGSLLIAVDPGSAETMLGRFEQADITARRIGSVTAADDGIRFDDGTPLPSFARDEIARYFDERN
jgi:hydrogenase expression/formation protein HypE